MAEYHSFKDYIEREYYNEIYQELKEFITDNPEMLEIHSYKIKNIKETELDDFKARVIYIHESEDKKLLFDVIASAQVIIKDHCDSDEKEQWFRISCSGVLDDGFSDFRISDVAIYCKWKEKVENRLSEYLVPVIKKEQLEDEAEKFLKNNFSEALAEPMAINPYVVAKKMGLNIKEVNITKSCTAFGQIFFSDSEINYFDDVEGLYKKLEVKRGTILIDPKVFFMRNIGSVNNTIIHECVHWDKHKNFFELEKMYNKNAKTFICQVHEGSKPTDKFEELDYIEWQANALAPRILMPAKQTRQKAEELISKAKRILQTDNVADIMEMVIVELAEFFEVSKLAAKIRLIDLGYKEAIGVFTFINDRYISNYSFDKNALKDNQTFTIEIDDALIEYVINQDFKKLIDSGNYLYVDMHYCINNPKYITKNANGYATLTEYAKQHMDECCLVFDLHISKNNKYGAGYYTECVLYRDVKSDTTVEAKFSNSDNNQTTDKRAKEIKKITDEANRINAIKCKLPPLFSEALVAHMKRKKCTVEMLTEISLIGVKTIQRLRNNENYPTTLGTIVALCIGLKLHPILSFDMINKAGFAFKNTMEHTVLQMLITSCYKSSIYECNEILKSCNFNQLGTDE